VADWVPLGDRAIRFARPGATARSLVGAIRAWPEVIDVVVARDDVAVYFAGAPVIDATQIAALTSVADDPAPARELELPVRYGGPDLDAVARATGLAVAEVCRAHAAARYAVETMGFAPGFAYLTGGDPRLAVPRLATPRARVPAGSLGIADRYSAVYPFDSPGGWHLIGSVAVPMFGPEGPRLQLGDRVRFVP
jgi:5-oxoprolinase (ATP-hydrolysing) subunit A